MTIETGASKNTLQVPQEDLNGEEESENEVDVEDVQDEG